MMYKRVGILLPVHIVNELHEAKEKRLIRNMTIFIEECITEKLNKWIELGTLNKRLVRK